MDSTLLIGVVGAVVVLIAFVLNQLNIWKKDYAVYDVFNLIGGFLLMLYAYILESWPFFILNFVWAAVSFKDVLKKSKPPVVETNEEPMEDTNEEEPMDMQNAQQIEALPTEETTPEESNS